MKDCARKCIEADKNFSKGYIQLATALNAEGDVLFKTGSNKAATSKYSDAMFDSDMHHDKDQRPNRDIERNRITELEKEVAEWKKKYDDAMLQLSKQEAELNRLLLDQNSTSSESSVVSFDSVEFLEDEHRFTQFSLARKSFLKDEQLDVPGDITMSTASCSISMHDITTIHEENEDDIAQERNDIAAQMDHARIPNSLINGDLDLREQEMDRTYSSVTDDSYMRCMSSEMDMGDIHQDFSVLKPPPASGFCLVTQPFNDKSSQSTIKSSQSMKYMIDILKEEAERRRNKINERISKARVKLRK